MHKHFPVLWQGVSLSVNMYISSLFNLHCIEKGCPSLLATPLAPMLWQFEAENPSRLLSSTHERIPVKAPTEENGPCPLIYHLSQEEGLLMDLELTSCSETHLFALSILYYSSLSKKNMFLSVLSTTFLLFWFWNARADFFLGHSLVTKNGWKMDKFSIMSLQLLQKSYLLPIW